MKSFFTSIFFTLGILISSLSFASSPIVTFSAAIIGEDVRLEWQSHSTAGYFIVEVATHTDEQGELIFTDLENIPASSSIDYAYIDKSAGKTGLRYYRVKQVKNSVVSAVSDIKTANFLYINNFTMNVMPDEQLKEVKLQVNSKTGGVAELKVSSLDGRDSYQKLHLSRGFNEYEIAIDKQVSADTILVSLSYNGDTQHVMLRKKTEEEFIVSE